MAVPSPKATRETPGNAGPCSPAPSSPQQGCRASLTAHGRASSLAFTNGSVSSSFSRGAELGLSTEGQGEQLTSCRRAVLPQKTCRKSSLQRSCATRPGRGRQGAPGGDQAGGWRVSVLSTTCSSSAGETCQHQLLCSSVLWGCLTATKRKKKKLPGFGYS